MAMSVAAHEPVFIQIALALGAALAVVMCLEGLYASLRPIRYAERLARNYGETVSLEASETDGEHAEVYEPVAVTASPAPRRAQRKIVPTIRVRTAKPKFRRTGLVNTQDGES